MLEEHVAYYLEKYLGNYVKGLSKEALKISVWQGNVELTNMQLKPEALNALKLPIKVKAGFLGSVKLKVPWSRLGQEPVIVELDRIFVLAEPATDVEGGDADAVQDAKNARVKEDETKFVTAKQEESRKQELNNSSWLGSLISTIIGNLKLSITNIHIRYEDTESNPGHPFAAGMTLAKLAAVTVDDNGKETFVTGGSLDRIQKSGELNRLSFYFDTDSEPWPTDKPWEQFLPPEWSKIFEPGIKDYQSDDIVKEGETPSWIQRRHNYLLEPVAGTAQYFKLGNEESRSPDRPAQKAVVILDDVTISLSERQYRDVLKLTENISTFSKRVQYAHYRPNVGVKEDARAWWQYSITAIIELQKKASGQMSWKQMLRLSHMRKQYVSKYVAALQANPDKITIDNNKEIQDLDRELDAGIILQWRMLAHTYVDQTRAEDAKRQQEEQAKGSWWFFGWGTQATNADSEGRPFTDEDWEQVNKIIGYQEGKPSMVVPGEDPPNMLHTVVEVRMNHNATKLLSANGTNILELSSEDLNCGIKLYPVAKSFDVKLASYKISCPEGLLGESATHEKAVNATFVLKPLEGNLDWKLAAKAAPCYVTVLKPAIDRVVAFFSSKEAVSQSVALETAAALQMTLDEVSKNAQQQLNQALKDKPKFSLDLDIAAPKITIPTDFFPDGKNQCKLLVDLGYLTLQTEEDGAADATQEELDLYMRFRIWLSDVSAFLVDGDFSWHKNYNVDATAGKLRLTDKESQEEGTWNGSGGLKSLAGEISVNGVNGGDVKIENGAGAIKIYEKSESGKCNSDVGFNFWPVLEKTGMAVALQQICVPHSLYASTRVAVRVPSLGFQFSPARFHRLMQVLKVFQSSPDDAEDSSIRPWDPADFEGQMSVLSWKGVGHREAVWQHRYGALAGPFLYLLESSSSQSYKYCASLIGKQVFNVPPESVGDVQNVLAVCDAGQFNNKVAESVGALLLRFEDEASLYAWQGRLSRAIYGASAPGLVTMMGSGNKNDHPTQVLQNSEGNEKMTLAAHETFYFVGALDELKIVISNSGEVDHTSRKFLLEPEKPLLEFRAIGSKVEFLMKEFDMQVGAVLESLEVEDKYHGHVSSSCRYLARSYIKESKKGHKNKKGGTKVSQSRKPDEPEQQQQPKSKALTETTRGGGSSSSQSAVPHKARSSDDRFFDATEDLVESDDGSRSPLRRRSFNRAAVIFYDAEEGSEDMEREPPSFKREVGLLPETTAASSSPADELSRSKSLQTFVKAQVIISSQESPEYANIDKEVRIGLSTLSFYCNRPTLIALMDLGTAITADVEEQPPLEESTQPAAGPTSTAGGGYSTDLVSTIDTSVIEDVDEDGIPKVPYERKDSVVKGLLGQGKDRVMFLLVVDMDLAQIVLNSDDGSQLATLSQENLHTEVKLYPASWGIKAALGNLRISDDGVDDAHHPYQYICDMRDPQGTSFIELEIVSFNADDEDYEGYEFSITGKMSELRIVFLNRFIQEVLAYGMGLIPPSSGEVLVKLKDRVTDVEKLFTQSEIEGQPSLKIDLSLMKPIIIMPRSSHSTDFLELDILHINIRSTSEWYGGSKDELGAVRLETMTLEIEDLHLVVGVGGQTGEGIIQEANGFSLVLRRPLRDLWHQVPAADLSVKIEELKAALSDKEYQVITECAISNMAETPNLPPSLFPSKEEATDKINKEKQIVQEESPPPRQLSSDSNVVTNEAHGRSTEETVPEISGSSANTAASLASENAHTTVKIGIGIDLVQLSLFVGGSRDNTLASIQVSGVWASLKQNSVEEMIVMATLERFSVKDDREGTDPEMCYMIGSADDRESNNLLGVAAATTVINNPQNEILKNNNKSGTVMDTPSCSKPGCRSALTMLVMDAKISPTLQLISVRMQRPRLLVAFDFLLAVAEFFIPSVHAILSEGKGDENLLDMTGGIFLSEPAHKQAYKDVEISPSKPLVADCDTVNEYVYDGQGNHLRLLNRNGTDLSEFSPEALIFIGDGKRLIFRNIIIQNGDFLDSCISLGSNSSYSASEDDGVFFEGPPEGSMDECTKHSASTNKGQGAEAEDKPPTEVLFDLQAIGPELTFYDSLKRPTEPLLVPERLVRARMNAFSRLCLRGEDLELNANLNAFTIESSSGVSVVEPFDATVKYSKVSGKQNIHVSMSEIYTNFSFSILQLILRLQDDVMAFMRITSEQITVECSEFDRIWVDDRPEEKSGGRNIAFWRPRPPPGFAVLGDCFTPRNEIPSKGVLALNMGLARVKRPVDFKLVWSSFDLSSSFHRGMNANGSANSLYGVVMAEEGLSGSNRADGKSFMDEDGEDQEQECSIWLPIPSPGYVALGCVVSRGHEPPSPTTALCVLATLVTPCSMKDCIYVSTQYLNETFEHQKQWAFWRVDNSIGSFFTQSGLDAAIKYKAYEIRHVINNYKPYTVHETEPATAVSRQLSGTPDLDVPQQEGTPPQEVQRDESGVVVSQGLSSGRSYEKVARFKLIWWDKGSGSRDGVSIWRPIVPPGCAMLGDLAVQGYEPPSIGLVLNDTLEGGLLAKPLRFQERGQISKRRGMEGVSFWYPVAPPGYIAMGCIASKSSVPEPDGANHVCCVRNELVTRVNFTAHSIWDSSTLRYGNEELSIWPVENEANTFFARPGRKRPPKRLALDLADFRKVTRPDNLTVDAEIKRISATFFDDFGGLMAPLVEFSVSGIQASVHGRMEALSSTTNFTLSATTYNGKYDAWEPLIEPCDTFVRFEYKSHPTDKVLPTESQIRVNTSSDLNVNVSTANMNLFLEAYASWTNLSRIEEGSKQQLIQDQRPSQRVLNRKPSRLSIAKSLLGASQNGNKGFDIVNHNELGEQLFLRVIEANGRFKILPLPPGGTASVKLPTSRSMQDPGTKESLRRSPVKYIALRIGSAELPEEEGLGGREFMAAVRVVPSAPTSDNRELLYQSARTRCVNPDKDNRGGRIYVHWDEIFVFEVQPGDMNKAEIVVTDLAQGATVGFCSIPLSENSGKSKFAPHYNVQSEGPVPRSSLELTPMKLLAPRGQRSAENNSEEKKQQIDCGEINLAQYFFSVSADQDMSADGLLGGEDSGSYKPGTIEVSPSERGPWTQVGLNYALGPAPWYMGNTTLASEIVVVEGVKHLIVRTLVQLSNDTDFFLDVRLCPDFLLEGGGGLDPIEVDVDETGAFVEEEVFEDERYQPLAGWGSAWPGHLLPTDPGHWSKRDLSAASPPISEVDPPPAWEWTSEWHVDKVGPVDQDGWAYAFDFWSLKTWPPAQGSENALSFIRRRRWVRSRQRIGKEKSKCILLGILEPGTTIPFPLKSLCAGSLDYCVQVRPHLGGLSPSLTHNWSQVVPSKARTEMSLRRSATKLFRVRSLTETEELLLCPAEAGSSNTTPGKDIWFCMESKATEIGKNARLEPIQDWCLKISAPLMLDNLLPVPCEYMVSEKSTGRGPIVRDRGIANPGEITFAFHADLRKALYLTWIPQGNWHPKKDAVLISHPYRELANHITVDNAVTGRRLKIQIQQSNEEKSNATKVIQLYVPYWLDTKKCPPLKYKLVAIGQHADKKGEYTGDLGLRKLKALSAEAAADLDQMENSPTMLSSFDCKSLELSVALTDSAEAVFGPGTPLQALDEADGSVELHAIDDEGSYFRFLITTTSSPFHFGQTKVVRIRPYMTFTNRLGQELILRQNSVNQARTLKASDCRVSFPFQETENPIMLQIQLAGSQWSHPFAIQKEESLHLMIRHDNGLRQSVQVDVRGYEDGSRFLVFFRLGSSRGPYRIENRTKFRRIKFRQAGLDEEAWQTLRPHSTTSFAWEHPQGLQLLEVVADGMEASDALKYDINKTGNQPVLTFDGVTSLSVCVHVLELGEIKAVRFFDQELEVVDADSSSNKEGKEIILAREGSAEPVQEDEVKRDVPSQLEIVFGIEKFGLSVIDHKPQEILFLSLHKVGITYSAGLGQENISRLKVMVRYIQLDNQLPLAAMPVLLAPETGDENEESVVKATINVYNDNSNVIAVYPYIGIRVTQSAWQINVHEPIIWAVMAMVNNLHLDRLSSDSEVVQVDPEIRIELIDVSEVRLKLTLETAPEQRPRGTLGIWSPVVTTIGNISKMPIHFSSVFHEYRYMRKSQVMPAILNRVRRDLIHQPLQLLIGVNVLGMTSSTLGTLSRGAAELSGDGKFLRLRSKQERSRIIGGVSDGLLQGTEALARGFAYGFRGVVTKPVYSARQNGFAGFFSGLGKAAVGVVVQPVSGALDFVALTVNGVGTSCTNCFDIFERKPKFGPARLPRAICGDGILRPYDEQTAYGQAILRLAQSGAYFGSKDVFKEPAKFAWSDFYQDHFPLPKNKILMLTNRRIMMLVRTASHEKGSDLTLSDPCTILWEVQWGNILAMEVATGPSDELPSHVLIHLRYSTKSFAHVIHCYRPDEIRYPQASYIYQVVYHQWRALGAGHSLPPSKRGRRQQHRRMTPKLGPIVDANIGKKLEQQGSASLCWSEDVGESSASAASSPALSYECSEGFKKEVVLFEQVWTTDREPSRQCSFCCMGSAGNEKCTIWRPIALEGYVSVGDVAYVGKHPPTIVMTYKNGKGRFAQPTGFDLVWRNWKDGVNDPISIWMPRAPEGYVALGCVAVPDYKEPENDLVWCVHSDLTEEAELEEYPVYHAPSDSPWHCFLYPVNSDSLTFMAMREQKHSGSPVPHRIISGILHEIRS